jgi:hypothetical protein
MPSVPQHPSAITVRNRNRSATKPRQLPARQREHALLHGIVVVGGLRPPTPKEGIVIGSAVVLLCGFTCDKSKILGDNVAPELTSLGGKRELE